MKWLTEKFIRVFLGRLASSNDMKATVLGVILAALLAAKDLKVDALLKGDQEACGMAAGVVVVALLGFYTNKKEKPVDPAK